MQSFSENENINNLLNIITKEVKSFTEKQQGHIKKLNEIGMALSAQSNMDKLLEMILDEAKKYTNADGGTLYLKSDDAKTLCFKVVKTDSLNIAMGGTKSEITWPPLKLYKDDGSQNNEMVAALCALSGNVINIEDVYDAEGFNFEGTKRFDANTGYRSKSMLVVPFRNHENDIIGVLQLINRLDEDKESIKFSTDDEDATLSLASQAAVAITNSRLIGELENLLMSFIKSISKAIDEKSPYTGGHARRVAEIAMLLANTINEDESGEFKKFSEDELRQIQIAGWMHDIGKITTPEFVVDKSTKLETIFDRVEFVKAKLEILKRDTEIWFLNKKYELLSNNKSELLSECEEEFKNQIEKIDSDIEFLEKTNIGGEFMSDDKIARLNEIAKSKIKIGDKEINVLNENELYNLSIRKGTLTNEEREKINDHARLTLEMLSPLPFPKKLKRVPEIASNHHEKLNGKGYPRGLMAESISLEARILAISDVFEALSASDRPYKDAKKLSECIKILDFMVKDGEIDEKLFKLFLDKKVHLKYAKKELKPEQIDIE